ncbi:hypothetical protein NL108_008034 [Boleophthalmus pectinirostris]|nr:hypothetical protein NL108_008034 [Boleophthalmus pectinirostris]
MDSEPEELAIMTVSSEDDEMYKVTFSIEDVRMEMEVDTGAARSVISQATYWKKLSHLPLQPAKVKVKAYNGGHIHVVGQLVAPVKYEDQAVELPLLVVKGRGASLCGRNWLRQLKLNWKMMKYVSVTKPQTIKDLIDKYSEVFRDELGTLKDIKASIIVRPEVPPKFCKHRPLPFAKEKVEGELTRLEEAKIISPVKQSEWPAPIVPVQKRDKSLRLRGDYKVSVNQSIEILPRLEELLATLSGGKIFSKIEQHISKCCWMRSLKSTQPSTHTRDCLFIIGFLLG